MTILLFLSFLLAVMPAAHDFKMSVCEINYIAKMESFEVRFYIFQDDLKEVLYGDPMADQLEETEVSAYILGKVKIKSNGQFVPLFFSEIKEREDQVQVVFFSEKITGSDISNLMVSNRLLIEKFKKQTNMVYVSLLGHSKKTKILNAGKTEGLFEF